MNYNQNVKIEQVTEETAVIGVDIGSEQDVPHIPQMQSGIQNEIRVGHSHLPADGAVIK